MIAKDRRFRDRKPHRPRQGIREAQELLRYASPPNKRAENLGLHYYETAVFGSLPTTCFTVLARGDPLPVVGAVPLGSFRRHKA